MPDGLIGQRRLVSGCNNSMMHTGLIIPLDLLNPNLEDLPFFQTNNVHEEGLQSRVAGRGDGSLPVVSMARG